MCGQFRLKFVKQPIIFAKNIRFFGGIESVFVASIDDKAKVPPGITVAT